MIMIPPRKSSRSVRALVICWAAASLTICHCGWSQTLLRFPNREGKDRLIATVDWYRPPAKDPEDYPYSSRVFIIDDLIQNVPHQLHPEAVRMLANADVVELSLEKAKHFGFRTEPDSVLRTLIRKTKAEMQGYQKKIAEYKAGRHPHISASQAKEDIKIDESLVQEKTAEIKQYQEWMARLRPYLIKGVALTYLPSGVDGYLIHSKDFILIFGTVLPPEGGHVGTLKRMPTVIYLPKKPQRVFTYMHNLD